jgi:tRNA (cytidine/uridine-2'-O-)-methyltransferase
VAMHIVLVEPEIPPNTGNVARTCAATGARLHLVEPLGFQIDEKSVRRAGLDYWKHVDVEIHRSLDDFMEKYGARTLYFASTKGEKTYAEVRFCDEDMILFGRETKGLPPELISANRENTIRIPMSHQTELRSLNLSNSAAIILFEALRQQAYPHLK